MPFLGLPASTAKPAAVDSAIALEHEKKMETGLVKMAVKKIEQRSDATMGGVEHDALPKPPSPRSSVEASPTASGTVTPRPRLTIAPCPARLTPFHPPKNFGAVEAGNIYRSGFPEAHNVEFLELLKLKTILTLVETEADLEVQTFTSLYDINHVVVPITANKEGEIRSTLDSLCRAILVAMNPDNYPLHIHCNRGKHRTGCIVACIRKIQRWPMDEIMAEYDTYSSPKARPEDIELIQAFDPASVYAYAKEHDLVDGWPRENRVDSATDIWELASALPPHYNSPSTDSDVSTDDALMMSGAWIDPTAVTYALDGPATSDKTTAGTSSTSGPEVSIAEVDEDVEME